MEKPHAPDQTMAVDVTGDVPAIEDQIASLLQGMNPDDVAELFQVVFSKMPGVDMQEPEPEPDTLYSPGAEGRPQVGFRLEELKNKIRGS